MLLLLGVLLLQLIKLESLPILESYVLALGQTIQVENEMQHLLIRRLMIEWNNRDAVVDLVGEGVHRIIYYDHVLHLSVCDDAEVLNVVAFRRLHTMLPIQPILEQLILWVDIVQNRICISLVRRGEDNHLKLFRRLLQTLHEVRS